LNNINKNELKVFLKEPYCHFENNLVDIVLNIKEILLGVRGRIHGATKTTYLVMAA